MALYTIGFPQEGEMNGEWHLVLPCREKRLETITLGETLAPIVENAQFPLL